MKEMRRLLSFLLALVMVIGFVPANAFAEETETVLDAAIFCSDLHGKTANLTSILGQVKNSGVTYSSIGLVGDTCLTVDSVTNTISSALGYEPSVMFSYAASHDTEDGADIGDEWNYSGEVKGISEHYLVYTIRETDMQNFGDAATAAPAFTTWYNGLSAAQKALPIFIMSHRPLHARRSDNGGAATWYSAISAAAETSDIVFFWAHNHTGEDDVDRAHYYVAKGEKLTLYTGTSSGSSNGGRSVELTDAEEAELLAAGVEVYADTSSTSEDVTINFTYMNAGYIDANGQSPKRKPVATTVQITADSLIFQDYTTTGTYTNATYSHNVTVEREFAAEEVVVVTPAQLVVTGTNEYAVGDTYVDPTVSVTYSDGSTKVVTDYEMTSEPELDMNTAGTYLLTFTYAETVNGQTYKAEAQFTVTVKEAETGTVNTVTGTDEDTYDVVTAVGEGLTGVTLTHNTTADTDGFYDCIVYDVALEGYVEGTTVTLTFDIAYMDSTDLVVYDANGNQLDILSVEDVIEEEDFWSVKVTVEVNSASGTYIIGKLGASEGAVITGIEVGQQPETTGYTLVDLNADNDIYLDITGLVINAVYDDGSRVPLDWNQFDEEKDGYALSFDINVAGVRTVTVTYGGFETSFDVTVYDTETVDMAADETVTAAVADVLTGEFVALDITPKDYVQGTKVRVVMPAPENANVVYHVAEDGTLTKIEGVTFHGGHAIFDTDHFSIYVAGTEQNSAQVSVPFTVSGTKTVYVLTSSISANNSYLIVNGNAAGSGYYALANNSGSVAATGVTIQTGDVDGDGDTDTYIELTDATDELWTVSNSYRFRNNGYYLRYSNGLQLNANNYTTWTYTSGNKLYYNANTDRYLTYSSGWTTTNYSSYASSIYFYIPTTVNYNISGDVTLDAGADQTVVYDSSNPTVTINPAVKLTDANGTVHTPNLGGTYSYAVVDDPKGIFTNVGDSNASNVFTLNAVEGTATIRVYYTWESNGSSYTVYDDVSITTTTPYYTVDIVDENGKTITSIIALKSVKETSNNTLSLDALVKYISTTTGTTITEEDMVFVGADYTGTREYGKLYWTANDFDIVENITFADGKATVSFTGTKDGAVNISVFYLPIEGGTADDWIYDTITVTVSSNEYYTPADGPEQFPDYPNPGSVNINKTATAVGNFSETGIAQIELYGNGVPVQTGAALDLVIMLDQSTSMDDDDDIPPTRDAVIAMMQALLFDKGATEFTEDTFNEKNGHRIYVGYYNGTGSNSVTDITVDEVTDEEGVNFQIFNTYEEYVAFLGTADSGNTQEQGLLGKYDGEPSSTGTEWFYSLKHAHDNLDAANNKTGYDRQQFVVFMTDGAPTRYAINDDYNDVVTSLANGGAATSNWITTAGARDTDYQYEYWSTQIKEFATIYGILVNETATQPKYLVNDVSGPKGEETTDRDTGSTMSKLYDGAKGDFTDLAEDEFFFTCSTSNADYMKNLFAGVGNMIDKAAAKDVTVYDQITDNYELIFELPDAITDRLDPNSENYDSAYSDPTGGQEFYIEVVNYKLDSNYNRTGEAESLLRVYLTKTNGQITASACTVKTAADGTETKTAVATTYTAAASGETGYFTLSNGVYTYVAAGVQTTDSVTAYNITAGAYAQGTSNDDMIIVTPYFTYTAATKSFLWTTDELGKDNQIALRYFVYLSDSLENMWDETSGNEIPAGPYNTNTVAWIAYTNHNDKLCYQYFPVPQLTWNGAQVTYVFYLVNQYGQPVNKAGAVIPFSNAVEVTDRYTQSVVWNDDGSIGSTELHVNWLAEDKLPDYYKLYDENAAYEIRVYKDENGVDKYNYFVITGDANKYITNSSNGIGDDDGVTTDKDYTTKVYIDKSSTKYDVPGTYTAANVYSGFDFSDTTVAFAVLWTPELQSDVVVVDFGLDVVINVTTNDYLANSINGIGAAKPDGAENTAVLTGSTFGKQALTVDNCTVTIENGNEVRVHQNSMEFDAPVKFYYDSKVNYTQGGNTFDGYMYSSVTVIPATTVYYEDSFLTLESYTDNVKDDPTKWAVEGTTINGTQDTDRPGDSKISFEIDADNVYGYDSAYTEMSQYSMGSAAMIHVDANSYGTAEFTFYGTGFDVISETSNMTGTIAVTVEDASGTIVKRTIVDTYYGYMIDPDNYDKITYTYWGVDENGNEKWSVATEVVAKNNQKSDDKPTENLEVGKTTYTVYKQRWITTTNNPNAVHQVPVIKIFGLDYGQYTATITATYNSYFDHTEAAGYDLYLDAIRIYDPTGNLNGDANDAYGEDNEAYPQYVELRDHIIEAGAFVNSSGKFVVYSQVSITEDDFANGTYYTKDGDNYTKATAYADGTTYYIQEEVNGAVFIDSNNATSDISDYTHYGPNNELYLASGQAIAFKLNLSEYSADVADVQIGMKLANSTDATYTTTYEMYNAVSGGAKLKTISGTIKTATDMYYSIYDLKDGTIVITNTGSDMLSLTNIKITFKTAPNTAAAANVVNIDGEAAANAVKSLSYVTPSTANFNPESMDIAFNRTKAEVGNNVIVTVTTSSDVKDLLVNGKIATNKTTSYLTGETTWSFTVPVVDNGSLKVTVVGYDSNGEYTVPYSESVTVINQSGTAEDLLGKLFG